MKRRIVCRILSLLLALVLLLGTISVMPPTAEAFSPVIGSVELTDFIVPVAGEHPVTTNLFNSASWEQFFLFGDPQWFRSDGTPIEDSGIFQEGVKYYARFILFPA